MDENSFLNEGSILYKIKSVDKLINRNVFYCLEKSDNEIKIENVQNIPSRSQMEIMNYILKHLDKNKIVYQRDLEKALNLRRATISGILGTMEKNGFIERTIDETDSRIKKITLSPKAKKMYLKSKKYLELIENIIKTDISKEDLEIFDKVISKMNQNLQNNISNQ